MSNEETAGVGAEPIAILAMAGRFPGAPTVEAFWQNLRDGVESISFFSDSELDRGAADPAELADPAYVKARGVLEGIEMFDASFFDFSTREAEITDPQHRVFLECAHEALERTGYEPRSFDGPIGLFAGAGANGYLLFNLASDGHLQGTANVFQALIHNKNDHLATRTAYKLHLRGPAVTVQTACSTSLVAVALACQSLLDHHCDVALAGGVSIAVPQKTGYLYHERGIGSPDGHCRPFDAEAQGTVGGSGAGVVVLRRLSDAIAAGDTILAVIRGVAVNNDGSQKVGYTAPSVDGQAEVIVMAQEIAGVEPDTIGYVEAHGTATPMGDPIEIRALTQAFRRSTERREYCAIGSVKSNVGHLDTAAGIAGLIKTVLALQHGAIPPSLHFRSPNPTIDFASSPFFVNADLRPWPPGATPRRAGVSSFGLGGTNAHVVLEEAPPPAPGGPSRPYHLLQLSAKSDAALETLTAALADHLRQNPGADLADVAYTLHVGRQAHVHRRVLVCRDSASAVEALTSLSPDRVISRIQEPVRRPVTFMFPGQGSQHMGMAREICDTEPVFREVLDRCFEQLKSRHDLDLYGALYPADPGAPETARKLDQTALAQPALFAIEYALAKLWMAWGVSPRSMIGHSVGEYVAACLASVFSLEDALDLVTLRGRLIQRLAPGAMLSVPLPEREVRLLLGPDLALAAINGPAMCVVAGPTEAVDTLEQRLAGRELVCRRLRTSHAFHSPMMEPAVEEFRAEVAKIHRGAPKIPFVSNVTGTWITRDEAADPAYWARHLRQTVRFADGLGELLKEPEAVLLEVGPGQVLRTIARWHPQKKAGQFMLASLPQQGKERQGDAEHLLSTAGHLWLVGVATPDRHQGEHRRRVCLPTYPFKRQRCWIDLRPGARSAERRTLAKRADLARWFYAPVWAQTVITGIAAPVPARAQSVTMGPQATPNSSALRVPCLVLLDRAGLGALVADHLREEEHEVITVGLGRAFRRLGAGAYEASPARPEDLEAIFNDLRAEGRMPEHVAYFWPVAPAASQAAGDDARDRAFYGLVHLARAIGAGASELPVRLTVVTSGAREVTGGDLVCPEQALAFGPCLVVPREYPGITCRSVDVSVPRQGSFQEEQLVEQLAREIVSAAEEPVAAYRGGRRWTQSFEEVRLEAGGASMPIRNGGVYLITGGLGGLGLSFARHLAATAKARLVLVGRTELPVGEARAAWIAAHGKADAISQKLSAIETLEAEGAEVLSVSADVTDAASMLAVVAAARERFGAIHGVIHAAGVPGGGLIQRRTREAAEAVFAPKVAGARSLEQALAGARLDFFVLCSSLTSVVGRLGQVDYAAANAFLDAFAHEHRARTGTLTVAVNWGAWAEVGMAARPATPAAEPPLATLDHPLLQRLVAEEPRRRIYATNFSVATQWIVDEHRIIGLPAVPGVTYFEMVRAALAPLAAGRSIILSDVYFLAPVRVPEAESCEVRLVLSEDDAGFSFTVQTQRDGGKVTDHTIGRARFGELAHRTLDLDAVRTRCTSTRAVSTEVEHEEDLGPRWRSVRRIYPGEGEMLLALEMPEAFAADFEHLKLHPALLDRASGMAKGCLGQAGFYLPLSYRSLTIHGNLPPHIYSHARLSAGQAGSGGETTAFDVTLADEHGRVLVEIEGLMQKRVKDPGAEIRALAEREAAVGGPAGALAPEEILPREGVDALDRILAWRLAPQVVVSVRDLQATVEQTDEVVRERIVEAARRADATGAERPRPNLKTPYVAPRNELEQKIAAAWQEVLGLDRVGVDDNFFDLGGDSVQAIQIIAKAGQLGVTLNPQQFFQYSSIGELGAVLGGMLAQKPEQGAVVGPAPLSPSQHRFFEVHGEEPGRESRAVVLEARGALDGVLFARAVERVLAHHDALRLRFTRAPSGWTQMHAASCGAAFSEIDLSGLSAVEHAPAIQAALARLEASLDVAAGPLAAFALVHAGADRPSRLLCVGHELVMDTVSFRILIEDLYEAYQQLVRGEEIQLRDKTASFKQWTERLTAEADSTVVRNEVPFWLDEAWKVAAPLAPDASGGPSFTVSVALTAKETASLVGTALGVHRAELVEAVAAALGHAVARWVGPRSLLVDLEADARGKIDGTDLSRTVGSLVTTYPVRMAADATATAGEAVRVAKEAIRRTPGHGFGYGLLRWSGRFVEAADKLGRYPRADVSLRHAGVMEDLTAAVPATLLGDGLARNPRTGSRYLLAVESAMRDGCLVTHLTCSTGSLRRATVEAIGRDLAETLRALAREGAAPGVSPVDFPLSGLDEDQLGVLAALISAEERT